MRSLLTIPLLAGALPLPVAARDAAGAAATAAVTATDAAPASPWTVPQPAAELARNTLVTHQQFMIIITVLSVVVFAIMLYSLIRHRKAAGHAPPCLSGTKGMGQWFWVMVPFAILLFIDFALMGVPASPGQFR